ncbi:phosphatidylglycerophosphatase A family protein [Flavisolibacter nicotianae]|uniref:phosphatidylglycerophosphatase A family protein n=1 Tax=Flavisolibacter nicotianae TaxID=2364882 RepID=UPI000EB24C8F|nr:phosphatidylglycerophosphatase A [Flavisolibacter nicotianae]
MGVSKLITTCFGIGYIQKGAGTVAALFCCLLWYGLKGAETNWLVQAALLVLLFFLGVWTATIVEKDWGKDSNRVVVDEVHGMLMALFLLPFQWQFVLAAFVLFRFFDIAKPLGVRRMEKFPGGWGVMLDDLLAGLYSNVVLQVVVKSHLIA